MIKKRILRGINAILSALLVALGFNSCDEPGDMYGPEPTSFKSLESDTEIESAIVDIEPDKVDAIVKE